jgi:hypothetical protein
MVEVLKVEVGLVKEQNEKVLVYSKKRKSKYADKFVVVRISEMKLFLRGKTGVKYLI